jgi:hypothetical protein
VNDLEKIIAELENQKAAIDRAITALREIVGPVQGAAITPSTVEVKTAATKRHISPEGRKRIIEATKRRWAAKRAAELSGVGVQSNTATKSAPADGKAPTRKGHISPEGRKKLAVAMKRRWAAKRAAEASAPASSKRAVSRKKRALSKKTSAA